MVNTANNKFSTWQFGTDHKKELSFFKKTVLCTLYYNIYIPSQNSTLVVKVGEQCFVEVHVH